jgi:hypothetical protein
MVMWHEGSMLKNIGGALLCALPQQGFQMVCFQTKNHNLRKFWRALDWKILWPFVIFYGHLEYLMNIWCKPFVFIWYIFSSFGIMLQE